MAARTGRPPAENPRSEKFTIYLTEEDRRLAEKARESEGEPHKSLAAWLGRKVSEMLQNSDKK